MVALTQMSVGSSVHASAAAIAFRVTSTPLSPSCLVSPCPPGSGVRLLAVGLVVRAVADDSLDPDEPGSSLHVLAAAIAFRMTSTPSYHILREGELGTAVDGEDAGSGPGDEEDEEEPRDVLVLVEQVPEGEPEVPEAQDEAHEVPDRVPEVQEEVREDQHDVRADPLVPEARLVEEAASDAEEDDVAVDPTQGAQARNGGGVDERGKPPAQRPAAGQ